MWVVVACLGLGISGLVPSPLTDEDSSTVATKNAVLELMSLAQGERTLQVDHHLGQHRRKSCVLR
jgi:hypothetical protein